MIVLKLRGARDRMKARTGRCEGSKPYGSNPKHPEEAEILAIMREMSGYSTPTAIARALNADGRFARSGKPWHPYAVSRILKAQEAK
jgi:hypothetical protein